MSALLLEPSLEKARWPWNAELVPLPDRMSDGSAWPRISIVTPSFNQGSYIEETICSVLKQGYPNLDYIIIDGGSTDNTVDVIKKYDAFLTFWVSESDEGQVHAIEKGFARADGEILQWINSDDLLAPRALEAVALKWRSNPDAALIAGVVENFDDGQFGLGHTSRNQASLELDTLLRPWNYSVSGPHGWHQPGIFISADSYRTVGCIDRNFEGLMDYELYLRMMLRGHNVTRLESTLAYFRLHPLTKTARRRGGDPSFTREIKNILRKHSRNLNADDHVACRRFIASRAVYGILANIWKWNAHALRGNWALLRNMGIRFSLWGFTQRVVSKMVLALQSFFSSLLSLAARR